MKRIPVCHRCRAYHKFAVSYRFDGEKNVFSSEMNLPPVWRCIRRLMRVRESLGKERNYMVETGSNLSGVSAIEQRKRIGNKR